MVRLVRVATTQTAAAREGVLCLWPGSNSRPGLVAFVRDGRSTNLDVEG